jgi:hypothetical protein
MVKQEFEIRERFPFLASAGLAAWVCPGGRVFVPLLAMKFFICAKNKNKK